MSDYSELKRLAEAATPGPWECREAEGCASICHSHGWVADDFSEQTVIDTRYMAAANPAALLELISENERLRQITKFDEAVACVFDYLKIIAANTSDRQWDDQLEDLAEDVIDYSPKYKREWKSIVSLSSERDQLKAVNFDYQLGAKAAEDELARLKADNARNAKNAKEWEEASLHWMAERDALKAEVEALRSQLSGPTPAQMLEIGANYWNSRRNVTSDAGAVKWVRDSETDALLIYTRGEYADVLMNAVFAIDATMSKETDQ